MCFEVLKLKKVYPNFSLGFTNNFELKYLTSTLYFQPACR